MLDRAAAVRLFVTDADGVWTDGRIRVHADGGESLDFHVHDGYALRQLQAAGVEVAVISGRDCPALAHRARRLGVRELRLGQLDKGPVLAELARARGLRREQIAAMGDDLPDLALFARANLSLAPPGAAAAVAAAAHYVTRAPGGGGALREACELLLAGLGKALA